MSKYLIKCFGHSLHLVILFYGTILISTHYIWCCVPSGLLLVLCVVAAVYYFRVPPPSTEVVESIIGKDIPDVKSPDDKSILKVVAHRGAILDVPENTLEAYSYCKKKGCNFIEFDVCLTADGVPIVFHDFTTGRLCNQDLEIQTTNWKDLKKLNLSDKHPHKDDFPETRIPTLEETVSQLLADGQKMFIDLKYRDPKLVKVVLDIFKKHPDLYNQAIVTSFFPSAIYQIRRQDPRIVGAVAWCPHAIYFASKVSYVGGPLWKKTMIHIFDEILAWLLPKFIFFLAGFSVILLHRYAMDVQRPANPQTPYPIDREGASMVSPCLCALNHQPQLTNAHLLFGLDGMPISTLTFLHTPRHHSPLFDLLSSCSAFYHLSILHWVVRSFWM